MVRTTEEQTRGVFALQSDEQNIEWIERLRVIRDELKEQVSEFNALRGELATIFGTVTPHHGMSWSASMLAHIGEYLSTNNIQGVFCPKCDDEDDFPPTKVMRMAQEDACPECACRDLILCRARKVRVWCKCCGFEGKWAEAINKRLQFVEDLKKERK